MSGRPRPLTTLVHERLAAHLAPGDLAVDATAGNGHDTVFLAHAVGPTGHVHAFDIQPQAIDATARRLGAHGVDATVTLHTEGHERMADVLGAKAHGRVKAVTFNLGYLPGAPKTIVTRPATTTAALGSARTLLAPDGIVSVLVYRGHAGALDEAHAVRTWIEGGPFETVEVIDSPGPLLFLLRGDRRYEDRPA